MRTPDDPVVVDLVAFLNARLDEQEPQAPVEVDAKRRIVDAMESVASSDHLDSSGGCYDCGASPIDVLSALALPYADHPDYRPEWKPREWTT